MQNEDEKFCGIGEKNGGEKNCFTENPLNINNCNANGSGQVVCTKDCAQKQNCANRNDCCNNLECCANEECCKKSNIKANFNFCKEECCKEECCKEECCKEKCCKEKCCKEECGEEKRIANIDELLNKMAEMISDCKCMESKTMTPLDNTVDAHISSSGWSRKEIAICCLKFSDYSIENACEIYCKFYALRHKYNAIGAGICDQNEELMRNLKTNKVVVLNQTDKCGRPMIYIELAKHDPKCFTAESMAQLILFQFEKILRNNNEELKEAALTKGITVLENMTNAKKGNLDFSVPRKLKLEILGSTPLKIQSILIYKPSALIKFLIFIGKLFFLPKNLCSKIKIIKNIKISEEERQPDNCLLHYVAVRNLPICMGGELTI